MAVTELFPCMCIHVCSIASNLSLPSQFVSQVIDFIIQTLSGLVEGLTRENIWLCSTCRGTFDKRKHNSHSDIPSICVANNLALADVPLVLMRLNPMEVRIICL